MQRKHSGEDPNIKCENAVTSLEQFKKKRKLR